MPAVPFKVATEVTIPFESVTNMIVGAIENGYSPWLNSVQPTAASQEAADFLKNNGEVWYASPEFWADSGSVKVNFDDPNEDEGAATGHKEVGLTELQKGLDLMAAKSPLHFKDLFEDNDDAETHDVFFQYVILGEIVYA